MSDPTTRNRIASSPPRLVSLLSFARCLEQLGCTDDDCAQLVQAWIDPGADLVVARASGAAPRDMGRAAVAA